MNSLWVLFDFPQKFVDMFSMSITESLRSGESWEYPQVPIEKCQLFMPKELGV